MKSVFSMAEKPVLQKKKRDQSNRRAGYQPKFTAGGRPSKRIPEFEKALLATIETGAPYRIACMACGISEDTFIEWRRKDPVFAQQVEKVSWQTALRLLKKIEAQGEKEFQANCWILERRFFESFSRPEVQLNLAIQNNVTENNLTIQITGAEYAVIEAEATKQREQVRKMFEHYRPQTLGNGERTGEIEVEATMTPEPQAPQSMQQVVITHRHGDEKRQAFWRTLVNSDPESLVSKETAVFAIRTLLVQLQGFKAHRARIDFDRDPVTLGDLFAMLEKLCGGASCWQLAQKLGDY